MRVRSQATPSDGPHVTVRRSITSAATAALFAMVAVMLPLSSAIAAPASPKDHPSKSMKSVRFMKRDIKMAGNLYFPEGFKSSEPHGSTRSSTLATHC